MTQRLFFALWPDDPLREAIQSRVPAGHGGRPVAPENLHLTLAFIGDADAAYAECLARAASTVEMQPFEFELTGLGCFRKPGVLWLGDVAPRAPLERLAQDLNAALTTCGFKPEAREYRPHVTVARKLKAPVARAPIHPIRWSVDRFCLVVSKPGPDGVRYEVVQRYPV
ncbi:RNA 2',3'-cyclic phosphodiesterase [Ectothiorhodospira sp. BSL-9]|uniref:RNA 2',3'-cyclic phosphodiesterase n=1 Tax=Ectothiorhodospira sp. BSL-9 TaxID=1442136 RepID=UPI0007B45853|nr:RNA 2',3'-cyclic phosphodiesterase [Ectothiorhodospira sp. BSL-9]ANB03822.1 hypothetical protein ECTOBSL9_2017 [Ectothiorhodospira sp. BSL-9]